MSNVRTITVTKIDAARRQLRTAIELWFKGGDPISIHALAYAAHDVIHRLFRNKGLEDLMFDSSLVKDKSREIKKEFCEMLKEDANWFKHANNDTEINETREFDPLRNELFLMVCLIGISRMNYSLNEIESAFSFWNFIHHRDWFPDDIAINSLPPDHIAKFSGLSRNNFLPAFLESWKEQGL